MADYSSVSIAAEDANATADRPLLASESAVDPAGVFKWTTAGDHGSSDLAESGYPTTRLNDDHLHLRSRHGSTLSTTYLSWKVDAAKDCDICILANTNFDSAPGLGITANLEISDSEDFTDDLLEIDDQEQIVDAKRVVLRNFGGTPLRYTGVKYARIKFVTSSPFKPEVGELFFGRRRQLKHGPNRPWDGGAMRVDASSFVASGGARTKYARNTGGLDLSPEFMLDTDDATAIDAWFAGTNYGAKKFWALMLPNTSPRDCGLFDLDTEIQEELLEGPYHRIAAMHWIEVPPFVSSES